MQTNNFKEIRCKQNGMDLTISYKFDSDLKNRQKNEQINGIFIVKQGSKIKEELSPHFKENKRKHFEKLQELIDNGTIINDVFQKDYTFTNLSELGAVCQKRSSNGQELFPEFSDNNIWALGVKEYGSKEPDRTDDFIQNGYWEYYGDKKSQKNDIKRVKPFDQVFLKSTSNEGKNGETGFMYIFATGIVQNVDINNKKLLIKWEKFNDKKKAIHTGYQSSIKRVEKRTNSELINFIFNSDELFFDKNEIQKSNTSNNVLEQVEGINLTNQEISNNIRKEGFLNSNTIFYGVPGCGKSYFVKSLLKAKNEQNKEIELDKKFYKRILFHPEYTYSDFIGQTMPVVNKETKEISYNFVPGPFTEILKDALNDKYNQYFLIIEEINRGNAPAIFGNIFQLLDRDNDGKSEYDIYDKTILEYLNKEKANTFESAYIPSNLTIFATMNTCDQNVFTLDTAFKRRWRMSRIKNDFNNGDDEFLNDEYKITFDNGNELIWKNFAIALNNDILKHCNDGMIAEDKLLGTHFIKKNELSNIQIFAEKIFMYLWNDVVKYNKEQLFNPKYITLDEIIDSFVKGKNVFNDGCEQISLLYKQFEKNEEINVNEENEIINEE